ncbi:unnamed protein product [Caenorhabditis bovis]|uniref:Methyltransferase domain-containing protein n=1 Tax=Caenorhabditis bovis TaxID=2654633 RepID=A0A8S1EF02_9PELO|nr:unnamed protein product [Caenorhabditis bovis]
MSVEKKPMKERLFDLAVSNLVSNAIVIGDRLDLFKTIANISSPENPVKPAEIAKEANCKERYVREWCNCLGCAGILEMNSDEKFWIDPQNLEVLTTKSFELILNTFVPPLVQPIDKLIECFKKEGPYGLDYNLFDTFQDRMTDLSECLHVDHVFTSMLPLIGNNIEERLEAGKICMLDVGCGKGFHSRLFAEKYPKSKFVGLDISKHAIEMARNINKQDGSKFENLEFIECDASKMPASWTNQFDFVFIFDACHDQMRPDLCIKEIHRVLKPGGVFTLIEIEGTSNAFEDKNKFGLRATYLYGVSMFHCLPVGSNCKDALCYGTMWGEKRATDLLKKCGFANPQVIPTPFFPINIMYLCKKD